MIVLVAAALIGVFIGVASGLLGIGGGTIMVPVFRIAFGMSAVGSTATSLFTIIPTSVSGVASHLKNKTCLPKLGIALGLGGACTSSLGVWLAQLAPSWAIMLAAAAVIIYSASTMLNKALKMPGKKDKQSGACDQASRAQSGDVQSQAAVNPDRSDGEESDSGASEGEAHDEGSASLAFRNANAIPQMGLKQLAQGALIGASAGIISGFVGVGGGFIMVPLMLSVVGLPMRLASGTSLVAVTILALPATVTQAMLGNIDYLAGIAVACGSIPGAVLGASLSKRLPERTLRFAFAGFLGIAAILLVVKEAGLLG
ncbi:MAG: sulfite exporter TauE/SafE family protein [Eggerthellaceae bacterium]|nr:sulfite exporter TauE/SafE family protein [Eggerthellaceae bacterium]